MTKRTYKKGALLSSIIALLLCFTMLIGTTFAWFTDSAASGSNVITSGNLDIEVQYTLGDKDDADELIWKDLDGATDLFKKGLWEPGHTEVVALKIENKGSLALKYNANMNIVDEQIGKNKDGKDIVLSEILTVGTLVQEANQIGDIALGLAFENENMYKGTTAFKASNVLESNQELFPGFAHYVIIKVDMAETVANEANHNGTDMPTINFGINVLATQFTYENDSFGSDYDKDAIYPGVVATPAELGTAFGTEDEIKLGAHIELPDSVADKKAYLFAEDAGNITLNLNGQKLTAANRTDAALRVKANTTLTITGNGEIEFGYALATIQDGATVIVENGKFYRDANADCGSDNTAFVKSGTKGNVIINGGYFDLSTKDGCGYGDHMEYPVWRSDLNLTINGGQFVDWDPSANIAAGASVTSEIVNGSTVYTVTPAN